MNITHSQQFNQHELLEKLRNVTLMNDNAHIKPYRYANIQLVDIRTHHLAVPQTYVLQQELLKIRDLRTKLAAECGKSLFRLNGFVRITTDECKQPIDILPIIVETSIEADGSVHLLINDGMHRAYVAHTSFVIPQVVLITGASFPYYAYPIRGGLDGVKIVDELPEDFIKKWHRDSVNYRSSYRDFNSAFSNVGASRGRFTKEQYNGSAPTKF